ncbi:MAG TPA: polysaccharide deacetylase family protein [Gemmatimonadales bacterium]|nr:polysaccharide deacetylase family protein [Gemmatimonadales bacterium]
MTPAPLLRLRARASATRPALVTFGYHDVTDDPSDSGFQRPAAMRYKLARATFAWHLNAIGAVGAPRVVGDLDLAAPGHHHLLTFDDGGHGALATADELSRRGWRGHFFLVTRLIGSPRFLSVSEVRALRSAGHVIGSHSHTHPDIFRDQPRERMDEEWRVSGDILAQVLGEPCVAASVPGGDISRATLASSASAGFRYLFTSEPWLSPRRVGGCWVLGRVCPTRATTPEEVAALARGEGWRRALLVRRLKGLARRTLPALYRYYVRVGTREFGGAAQ